MLCRNVKESSVGRCLGDNKCLNMNLLTACLLFLISITVPSLSYAGKKFKIDDNHWVSIGLGLRTSFISIDGGAPDGGRKNDFDTESIRLLFSAQLHEKIKFTFNTEEIFSDGPVDVLESFAQFELDPLFNIWVGKMLTPADRIALNGPYNGLSWNQFTQPLYPSARGGAAGRLGRDYGVTVWGTSGKFRYAVGVFDGLDGFGNHSDDLLFAGRLAYNFLNKEDNPGYYTSGTYHGKLGNILTLGVSFQSQDGGTGSATKSGDFRGYTIDLLSETIFKNGGVLNVEAEYKKFDADFTIENPTADACFCLFDGDSYFALFGYLFPGGSKGRFQPYVRFVENSPSDAPNSNLTEVGLNYVISGHNARLNLNFSSGDANISGYRGPDRDSISFGLQLKF